MAVLYSEPRLWIRYDLVEVSQALIGAKAAVQSLLTVPFQREWVEKLQTIQLKMEVAGTSRIEGADFTESELDTALRPEQTPAQRLTHSQRQAQSALAAYQWIATLSPDRPVNLNLVCEIHRLMVTGCDDDVCPPGQVRRSDQNVTFGLPTHRGATGGPACHSALEHLLHSVQHDYQAHDPLVQAIALHYHIAAMHPFLDGNGRTARALESFMFQRAGLRDTAFIAMSNYYYDEKNTYLIKLAEVRSSDHDLTSFLNFALKGLEVQCTRLLNEIRRQIQKTLFKDTMYSLFNRLKGKRTRVIRKRQIDILQALLDEDDIELQHLWNRMKPSYVALATPVRTFNRDLSSLYSLGSIQIEPVAGAHPGWNIRADLAWPTQITESAFFAAVQKLPQGKTYSFLT